MPTLGVNIDHVATLRQARYARDPGSALAEPDIVRAAALCEAAGADGITAHLREDRRHIQDADIRRLREAVTTKLNLEMANVPEILAIALAIGPEDVCLVPENRTEITTEGGLDADGLRHGLAPTIGRLRDAGVRVSLFIDPDPRQVAAAADLGAPVIELHTGSFATSAGAGRARELDRLRDAADQAHALGLTVHAGHGINYGNIREVRGLPHLAELNIGHSIVSRAVLTGLDEAVREMRRLVRGG